MDIKDATISELSQELRSRKEVVAVQVWQIEDIKNQLIRNSYKPTEDKINAVIDYYNILEDCSGGWEILDRLIYDCDFGDSDLIEEEDYDED